MIWIYICLFVIGQAFNGGESGGRDLLRDLYLENESNRDGNARGYLTITNLLLERTNSVKYSYLDDCATVINL